MTHKLDPSFGSFAFPDPRDWPAEAVWKFQQITGAHSVRELFIFDIGEVVVCLMQDAIAARSVLRAAPDEWSINEGFPTLVFGRWKIQEYTRQLEEAGYQVCILTQEVERNPQGAGGGKVVDIGSASEQLARRRRKWA